MLPRLRDVRRRRHPTFEACRRWGSPRTPSSTPGSPTCAVKQQPNLVFAAARWHGATPREYAALKARAALSTSRRSSRRSARGLSQTNEVGASPPSPRSWRPSTDRSRSSRSGASAGLCLFPTATTTTPPRRPPHRQRGTDAHRDGERPCPGADHPDVTWRGGVDLNPLDVTDDDAMAWLTTSSGPSRTSAASGLREAVAIARREPPYVVRGDLLDHARGARRRPAPRHPGGASAAPSSPTSRTPTASASTT